MIDVGKRPGEFQAVLAYTCLGAFIVQYALLTRSWVPRAYVGIGIVLFLIFWTLSWAGAILAVRRGDERERAWGYLALILLVFVHLLVLLPNPSHW